MFLPLIHRGDRTRALVIGGGAVALRKVEDLLAAGASVEAISPAWDPALAELLTSRSIPHQTRPFHPGDTRGFNLVIVATDDARTNRAASEEAREAGIPVNVVDQPELCTVYFAAVVRRDPLLLAISTGGAAPFFAREMKRAAEEWLDGGWAERAHWAERLRDYAREQVEEPEKRERLFSRFMEMTDRDLAGWNDANPPVALWARWTDEEVT